MAGNHDQGIAARDTNRKKYGADYYQQLGHLGGRKSKGGGFANDPERASKLGKIGGAKSKRPKGKKIPQQRFNLPSEGYKFGIGLTEAQQKSLEQTSKLSQKYGQGRPW